ncbi:glycosyltransferase family 4 protein [Streptomyces sp. NPDC059575]|uniref:glycosyltransferase family 4 protein n=1 Tax=Streptomyces sp. NPDC059575 TaxID=3346872 RepID=UPI00369C4A6E
MRLLYLLNVSNASQLSADSGFTVAELLSRAFLDCGVEVTVASPVPVSDARAQYLPMPSPPTKYRARFEPGMDDLLAAIRAAHPDVVVANQIEAAPAVRAALLEARIDAQVVGYCHYLPFFFTEDRQLTVDPAMDNAGLGRPVMLAFAAGLAACDRVLVHSATAASGLRRRPPGWAWT